jgi:methionine-rich copper-binding protein CopC
MPLSGKRFKFSARIFRRTGAVLAAIIIGLLVGAPAASAHSVLLSSSPAKDSSIPSGPPAVVLEFNEALDHGFTELVILGPDGTSHWEAGPAKISSTRLSAPLRTLGPAGSYAMHYRVISADGHPVSGTVNFTLTAAGPGTPATPGAAGNSPAAGAQAAAGINPQPAVALPSTTNDTVPAWPWIAGGVVLLGVGIVVARRIAR